MPYQKQYVYIADYRHNGVWKRIAFTDIDQMRIYLVYGFLLPFESEKLTITDADNEIIYDQDFLKIEKCVKYER